MKLKVARLFVGTVAVGALITTLLFTGFHIKSFRDAHVVDRTPDTRSFDSNTRSLPAMDSSISSTSSREHTLPSKRISPSVTQPTIYHDCKSWKKSPQHKTTLITRSACAQPYTLLILVSSEPINFHRRIQIRETWGPDKREDPQWKTFFLIAQARSLIQSDMVQREQDLFGDLIRADYYEHYWNQSLKIQMAFEWAARYCNFSFLLKADDDVLVNGGRLIDFLKLPSTPKEKLFIGKLHKNPVAQRDGKWTVSYEEYNGTHYPDFCSGAGFVMTYDVIECVVPLFDVMKPYRLDDVYVGMLAHRLGVVAKDHSGFVMPWSDYDKCNFVPNTLVQHRASGDCLMKLFKMHNNSTKAAN